MSRYLYEFRVEPLGVGNANNKLVATGLEDFRTKVKDVLGLDWSMVNVDKVTELSPVSPEGGGERG